MFSRNLDFSLCSPVHKSSMQTQVRLVLDYEFKMALPTELSWLLSPCDWQIGITNSKPLFQTVLPGIRMDGEQINNTGNVYIM